MKKRRFAIAAFLIVAVLVMGIGFAAVADTLTISGRASFRPATFVSGEVAKSIHFVKDYNTVGAKTDRNGDDENVIPTLTASVTDTEGLNAADLTFVINGVAGRTEAYTVTATYKVIYETSAGAALPDVDVSATAYIVDGTVEVEGFAINVAFSSDEAGLTPVTTMSPGDEAFVTVTATYTLPATAPSDVVAGTVNVSLHFSTPDA